MTTTTTQQLGFNELDDSFKLYRQSTMVMAFDFVIEEGSNKHQVTVKPCTDAACVMLLEVIGRGGVIAHSLEMPKAYFDKFVMEAQRKGLTVA
jgi:hypothetical protein